MSLAGVIPAGIKWTCTDCGTALETPARVVPKDGICSLCKTGWEGPVPCDLPGGQWCQYGWHHRVDAYEVKHAVVRCSRALHRLHDEKAAEYLETMKRKGAKKGFRDFDRDLQNAMFEASLKWANGCEGSQKLALLGPPGTGKTHLMEASRYYVLKRGLSTAWIDRTDLSLMVNAFRSMGSQIDRLMPRWESWCEASVIFIDDLGHEVSPPSETAGILCDLLDERGPKPLAFASNMARREIQSRYHANTDGDGPLVSRLFHNANTPPVRKGDYRSRSF